MTLSTHQLATVTGGLDRAAAEAEADKWGHRISGEAALTLGVLGSRVRGARFVGAAMSAYIGAVFGYLGGHAYGWDQAVQKQQQR